MSHSKKIIKAFNQWKAENNQVMNDPNDPRNEKEPEQFFCKCEKCKGDSVGYDFNDMLDPFGDCISRWCAGLETLQYFENAGPVIAYTNAEFELRKIGAREFFKKYYNLPLEPFIKPDQVDKLFDEIYQMSLEDLKS